ncbi:MAG: Xaa-Pro peptidase family protein [Gemmatimonadota bacterium]|uniref:Xaa-Pro peptidase family protein n=1 Tax=Candidatus Palauibacter scopulicola TaxID=3056741 RepID=UPI00239B7750|nr:Xaa-Pro peptidase family protein [Candidatus Palauibacter scopulicola]MDE2662021.1 Xaa-Pro peptidase family protein [Candidatus Palauibacter scopulicola]
MPAPRMTGRRPRRRRFGRRGSASSLLAVAVVLGSVPSGPTLLSAQTPEQRYSDWVRPGFRPQEYEFRRNRIVDGLRATGGGLLLVPSSDGITHGETFRQLEDFWYLTGLEVPQSMLVLDASRGISILFMPQRDPRFENPGRPNDFPGRPLLDDYQIRGIGGADDYRGIAELDGFLRERVERGEILRVNAGAAGEVPDPAVPLIGSLDPTASLIRRLRDDFPEAELVNAFEIVARLRMVKSPAEIMRMRRAADATMRGIRAAAALVRPGVDERTLQGEFERACRQAGAQSIPFTPIIKSGPNSLWPWRVLAAHYDRRNRTLQDEDLVIFDVGCEINGYVSDVGRTFPANGAFTEVQREKLLVSTRAAEAVIAAVRPGVTLRELTQVAYDAIPDEEERYMQTPSFFGHHIGLSTGDPALLDEPLAPGMVFTIEPWYYNHDLGVSVFVEEVVLVTEDGAEVLTDALPRDPAALEGLVP